MRDLLFLLGSLGVILGGAELFTNGVEWLGKKLRLSEGTVGSILAAVGTALPETSIPVIALLLGQEEAAQEIGIGAILGAPFMLGTLALFITGLAAMHFPVNGSYRRNLMVNREVVIRDLEFFLLVYSMAIFAAFLRAGIARRGVALFLVGAYLLYVYRTVTSGSTLESRDLPPLYLDRRSADPAISRVAFQVGLSLLAIAGGARLFVAGVASLATAIGASPFILSLVIAPVATELPEKFNSIIWLRGGKDTLALGNITGAMVFQSSLIPALGILLTPWLLDPLAVASASLALASAGLIYLTIRFRGTLPPTALLVGGFFYSAFIITVTAYHRGEVAIYLVLVPVLALLFYLDRRYRGRVRMQNQVLPGPEGG